MEVLVWAREHGFPWGVTSINAARGGRLDVLQWAVARGCSLPRGLVASAAEHGHHHIVMWALESGSCPFSEVDCCQLGLRGWLDALLQLAAATHNELLNVWPF